VDCAIDLGRRAVAALLVARAVPGSAVLGVSAVGSQVGEVERLAREVGEGEVDREAALGRFGNVGNGGVNEDDGRELALVVGGVADDAINIGQGLAGYSKGRDAGGAAFADDLGHGSPGAVAGMESVGG
jgi:hypothetical protein